MTSETTAQNTIYRRDYQAFPWRLNSVELSFDIGREQTEVTSQLSLSRDRNTASAPLQLDGVDLELLSLSVNGRALDPEHDIETTAEAIQLTDLPDEVEMTLVTRIHPAANTALEGLYVSGQFLLTQCEAEGFRKITYFPDRPDVMTVYTVHLNADASEFPVLLSNGNCIESVELDNGRHRTTWHDPAPKPCYLFALVAGDLEHVADEFQTRDGRKVSLKLFAEKENMDSVDHAMQSLKRSMQWDEERFGLVYDLDIYHIVATNDFNMGAMENKSLNIFNSKYVLARPETATDTDFINIEAVIGHEYFHNWTGNRVTCRDWFQLSLKEGLTVFRDQEFTADMQSRAVKRIDDVRQLRSLQFAEDAGPMAHPVRPDSYQEINNFYTVTVYEKGAEVVRMVHTLLGEAGFQRGMSLYFERHDGQAVTCDDFRAAMADANDVDLTQFERWYSQAGTPRVQVSTRHDPEQKTYTLNFRQVADASADGSAKEPFHIPVRLGLLDSNGNDLPLSSNDEALSGDLYQLTGAEQSLVIEAVTAEPVPSLFRGFSAPVITEQDLDDSQLAFLMAHDSDSFNRWDAGQTLAKRIILSAVEQKTDSVGSMASVQIYNDAALAILRDGDLDPALVAVSLALPDENYLATLLHELNPVRLHSVRKQLIESMAQAAESEIYSRYVSLYASEHDVTQSLPILHPERIANRALQNRLLSCLSALGGEYTGLIADQYHQAEVMTESLHAMMLLVHAGLHDGDAALEDFLRRWQHDPLVMDKWLMVQATSPQPGTLDRVRELLTHPVYDGSNPNKIRSLIGSFSRANPLQFHAADGSGYDFLADQVIELDRLNPQVTSRLVSAFNNWKQLEPERGGLMRQSLQRIHSRDGLSRDVSEIVGKALD